MALCLSVYPSYTCVGSCYFGVILSNPFVNIHESLNAFAALCALGHLAALPDCLPCHQPHRHLIILITVGVQGHPLVVLTCSSVVTLGSLLCAYW